MPRHRSHRYSYHNYFSSIDNTVSKRCDAHSCETASRGAIGLGPFEPHADAEIVEVDRLPLPRVPQNPGQVFNKLVDRFAARAFADRLGAPRAKGIIGAIEVDLDDDELRIIRIFAILNAHRLIAPIARAWIRFDIVGHAVVSSH